MIFLIPARAGSKRLPGKNKRLFCGLPLWMWSALCARRVGCSDAPMLVSTDDKDILDQLDAMLPWMRDERPADLCRDDTSTQEVVDAYWRWYPHENCIVLLQPTSPTRSDSLVCKLITHGGQVRSVTNGQPNGQCWVYRRGVTEWVDVETEQGHDIDTLEQFNEAEKAMMEKFK